nr:alpha V1 [Tomato leaf curl Virudhunagar alphasatellite]
MSQSRNWCFTLFTYVFPLFSSLPDWINYLIFQGEGKPDTKRKHFWGGFPLKRKHEFSFLRRNSPMEHPCEQCKGSASSNRDYSKKGATRTAGPWEFGVFAESGSNKRKTMERFEETPKELRLADPKLYRRCLATRVYLGISGGELPDQNRLGGFGVQKILDQGPDDRTIKWVYGSERHEGKTTWAKKKIPEGGFYSRGGKGENIQIPGFGGLWSMCYWNYPDKWRKLSNLLSWGKLKAGLIRSSKYEPFDFNCRDKVSCDCIIEFYATLELEYIIGGEIIKKPLLSRDRVFIINHVCMRVILDDLKEVLNMYLE